MNEEERRDFIDKEIEAIYEEIDNSVNQLALIKRFLQKVVEVSKGEEPNYDNLANIVKRIK